MHNRELNALQFSDITVMHHKNEAVTYTVKWSSALPSGVTISTSEWTSEDPNLTIANKANDDDEASARFSASAPGKYIAVNKITDSSGDIHERLLTLIFSSNSDIYS